MQHRHPVDHVRARVHRPGVGFYTFDRRVVGGWDGPRGGPERCLLVTFSLEEIPP